MKSARVKLAVLAVSAVVIVLAVAAVAFNLFIGWKVESDAVSDIEYALSLRDDARSTGRVPNYFLVDSAYHIDAVDRQWTSEGEQDLAEWFSGHSETRMVRHVVVGGWACYAAIVPAGDYEPYHDGYYDAGAYFDESGYEGWATQRARQDGYYIAYIDTASEQELIASVNTAFVVIGLIGAIGAALAGYVAGRRIDEAQEAQKRFYENMSHDLKTPLAAIRGYAEGASGGVVDVGEASRAIVRETDRMTEAINQILGLSRLEAGAVQPNRESVVMQDFVQDCLMPFEGAVRAKGIDVELDLAAGELMADPELFDRALSNVLTNAVRHAASRMRVSYDGARLAVWNDGGAPDAAELPHLFDRFHAGAGGSTGIGLAIAKEVASLHGWDISARAVDDGLEVVFTF